DILTNDDFHQERLAQLELLDECRLTALDHLQIYQKRIKRAYDKRLHEHTFKAGDLVLKENQHVTKLEKSKRGKFTPNWIGPYIITHTYGSGTYRLALLN
ncbi:hypothetical protein KI387_015101, partial [Taxus chinensis]